MAPSKRKRAMENPSPSKKSRKTSETLPKKQLHIKLDEPFAGDHSESIYRDGARVVFDVALKQTNMDDNNDKFYMLQLIESAASQLFVTHTRWSVVGERGQFKTSSRDLETAKKGFEKTFKDNTGLSWEKCLKDLRGVNKYTYVETNYYEEKQDEKEERDFEGEVNSKLPLPTQRLIKLIFNDHHFKAVLEDIGYNREKLPLGELSDNAIKKGFKCLKDLANIIETPSIAANTHGTTYDIALELISNQYYSTIPHITGTSPPPVIEDNEKIRQEVTMLDTLSDMLSANEIVKNDNARNQDSIALVDKRFNSLGLSEMTPLSRTSCEYKELSKYLIESSGSTHGMRYHLEDIFRIERIGEKERFESSEFAHIETSNRLLLWHGSRTSSFGSILSEGLRIPPREAPVQGYAFGKGVYLADCSSKSAKYCYSAMSGGTGLLLLCEAELSSPIYELQTRDSDAESKAKKRRCISTKGVGMTVPQKWKDASCVNKDLKGVWMPDGPVGPNDKGSSGYLVYNEYVAYDITQVRLRYLFKVGM